MRTESGDFGRNGHRGSSGNDTDTGAVFDNWAEHRAGLYLASFDQTLIGRILAVG